MKTGNVVEFAAYKEDCATTEAPQKTIYMSKELGKAIEVLIQRLKDAEPLKQACQGK